MSTIVIPGAALAVEVSDEGGHPVVQLHGLASSRARERVLDLDLGCGLSGTRLLRFDARGHGRSSGRAVPEDYRWRSLAEDLLRLLDEVFPGEQVHGVGPSMGAATLLHAAVAAPDRFSGLTLMIPPTAWETRVAQAETYRAAAALIEEHGLRRFVEAAAAIAEPPPTMVGAPEGSPEVPEDLLPSVYRGAALSDLPSREEIARLPVPTSILAWVEDPSHPLSTAEALVDLLPQATLQVAATPHELSGWPAVLAADVAASARRRSLAAS
ncbi:alpha/beta fold hydrolase [Brachybacterium sp. AOP43-C2-M15]|uniref:alpha/beta fold hydrolase n=1 Tax=Brachybacterium sp. AOP43-C2-M15 TaxID=3457661 RepID=UPI0040343D55